MEEPIPASRAEVVSELRGIYVRQRPEIWRAGDLVISQLGPMDLSLKIRHFRLKDRDRKAWLQLRVLADESETDVADLEKAWERASAWSPSARDTSLPWKVYDRLAGFPKHSDMLAEFLVYCQAKGVQSVGSAFGEWFDAYLVEQYNISKRDHPNAPPLLDRSSSRASSVSRIRIPRDALPAAVGAAVLEYIGDDHFKLTYIRRMLVPPADSNPSEEDLALAAQ